MASSLVQGRTPMFDDLRTLDPELHRSLLMVRSTNCSCICKFFAHCYLLVARAHSLLVGTESPSWLLVGNRAILESFLLIVDTSLPFLAHSVK